MVAADVKQITSPTLEPDDGLPSRPLHELRDIDMTGRPAAALRELMKDTSGILNEMRRLHDDLAATTEQVARLPEQTFAELQDYYAFFIGQHEEVCKRIELLAAQTSTQATALTATCERQIISNHQVTNAAVGLVTSAADLIAQNKQLGKKGLEQHEAIQKLTTAAAGLIAQNRHLSEENAKLVRHFTQLANSSLWPLLRAWVARHLSR